MPSDALYNHPVAKAAQDIAPNSGRLTILALFVLAAAIYVQNTAVGLGLLAIGLSLIAITVVARVVAARVRRNIARFHEFASKFIENDVAPAFITDSDGQIIYRNATAIARFGANADTLSETLEAVISAPSSIIRRMRSEAQKSGYLREELAARSGHVRVSAYLTDFGRIVWRLEDVAERLTQARSTDTLKLPMMTISKAGTVLYMNEALRRQLGGRLAHIDRFVNNLPLENDKIQELSGADGIVRYRATVIDGSVGRKEVYFVPLTKDIVQSGERWENLEELPVAMLKTSVDGRLLNSNVTARKMLAIECDKTTYFGDLVEGLGRSVGDWLLSASVQTGELQSEFVRATRQGKDLFLQVTLSRVIEKGKTTLLIILNDATKLKTLEEQFVQSQKMQAIGQLAGGVAHDFNNLLTAISGHCDLLMLRHDSEDNDYGDLVQISQNANRAASLVGQLLAFSRKQTLKPEVIEPQDTLEDLGHLLGRLVGEKVTIQQSHEPGLPPIRADKRQLEQVIMNLVVNARDAMPEGGKIFIETRAERLEQPYQRERAVVPEGEYLVIMVRDQGSGIAPEKLPKIFEPFYTTKRTGEGTGLGLSMAYGIVKQSGGFIFADSIVGSGTTFTLFFPAHVRQAEKLVLAAPEILPAPEKVTHSDGGVVLLVEDEAPVRAFAARALKMRGYTVVEADCAEEALRMLEDPELKVDVFVTDVIMPGMDGPSWVAKALEVRPDTKVVFVSGYAEDSFSEQQERIPNSVFLPKPFSLSQLTTTVSQQFH